MRQCARVRQSFRCRGGLLAARRAGAAGRAHAAYRHAHRFCRRDPDGQARQAALIQGLAQWAGSKVATCGSMRALLRAMPTTCAGTRPSWSRSRRTSSWHGGAPVEALLRATRTVPIVFTIAPDPVGAGYVESLARPGGNVTGFMMFEFNLSGKWLELLKEIAPSVTRAAVLRDAAITAGIGQFAVIQSVAPSLGWRSAPSTA